MGAVIFSSRSLLLRFSYFDLCKTATGQLAFLKAPHEFLRDYPGLANGKKQIQIWYSLRGENPLLNAENLTIKYFDN